MISLRMFFVFEVEVLRGFEAWFLESFCTSESWCLPISLALALFLKCLRKASIYKSLGMGEQHVAESNWWHMPQPDWSAYVTAYTRWIACVIAYTCEAACVIAYTHWCVIWFLHNTWQISIGFLIVIAKPSSNTWCFVIGCICGFGSVTCQLVIGWEFSLSTMMT